MESERARISAMLADDAYHMEFHSYLSNHSKHAVIALDGLGAPADYIEKYISEYANTTYGFGLEVPPAEDDDLDELDESTWRTLFGKKVRMGALKRFFAARVDDIGVDAVLRKYVPEMINGGVGSLMHATIHLGWAIHSQNEAMIVEGLAYLAFAHVDCYPSDMVISECDTIAETFRAICTTWHSQRDEMEKWVDETVDTEAGGVLAGSGLQMKISQVLARRHPLINVGILLNWKELERVVTVLFLTQPGNFVLLHVATCLFGMKQIASKLDAKDEELAAKCFWKSMLAVLVTLKSFPTISELEAVEVSFGGLEEEDKDNETIDIYWKEVETRSIADKEEHNAKLVYVMKQWYEEHGNIRLFRQAAQYFTTTPVIG